MPPSVVSSNNEKHPVASLLGTLPRVTVLILAAVMLSSGQALSSDPCSADPSWPYGQRCSSDPYWPPGQDGFYYDPNCQVEGQAIYYTVLCRQEGEVDCGPEGCMECWDCIDNDGDGLFDCMDNLDSLGEATTEGGCGAYCNYINPLGTEGGYNQDQDGDGFLACPFGPPSPPPPIYDCDDSEAAIHSGAAEICDNAVDEDCNGIADITGDADGDGHDTAVCGGTDCDDSDAALFPGAPEVLCDGIDNDCDPATVGDLDDDGDGSPCNEDCNDDPAAGGASQAPGLTEVCDDGIDNDCDELIDSSDDDCPILPEGDDDDSAPPAANNASDSQAGCSCSSSARTKGTGLGLGLVLALTGLRRRRVT